MDMTPAPDPAQQAESLLRSGDFVRAAGLYRSLLDGGADGYGLRVNYAQCLKRQGHWAEAIAQFETAFRLRRQAPQSPDQRTKVNAFYLQHLVEQVQYLKNLGLAPQVTPAAFDQLQRIARLLRDFYGIQGEGPVPADLLAPVADLVLGCVNRAQEDGPARLNPDMRIEQIDLGVPGSPVYLVDDFLAPETLAAMRRFLLQSTIWYDARAQRGYLGAHLHDGLACDLVRRMAEAVLDFATGLIGPGFLSQVWAFRYAPKAAGIDLHADQANWNVNMWLTDTAFNRRADSGGMTIHGCRAPDDWQFEMYNASPDQVRAYLTSQGAPSRRIDYRANRAVVFDSRLFHKTDPVDFAPDFDGRRINMTFMIDTRS